MTYGTFSISSIKIGNCTHVRPRLLTYSVSPLPSTGFIQNAWREREMEQLFWHVSRQSFILLELSKNIVQFKLILLMTMVGLQGGYSVRYAPYVCLYIFVDVVRCLKSGTV